ncbi:CoA pyrophosphatase [uncultured Megasphaera sp.]|jgi:coenzyme A diphosphatase NUDT7|uniref:NUDIX hydrolase n=1 Tax=uncultured Megasphaera sp. TaxID=165188 RepID=UPI0025F2674B|nr:CoA pyrophosphatase [uncultured Megasphaera sp.]
MKDRLTPNRTVHHLSSLNNTPCAVILPILTIGGEEHILFEVRSSKLAWQPRDICFPGGRIEKSDASALDAAIRETIEELGVDRSDIDILGPLDYIESMAGVTVWPFAARIHTQDFTLSHGEIAEIFTAPISYLRSVRPEEKHMEIATRPGPDFPEDVLYNSFRGDRSWKRRKTYSVYIYRYKKWPIWGITAHILRHFLSLYQTEEDAIETHGDPKVDAAGY